MANETKHVAMNKAQQEKLDQVLRGICKERKVAVEADLDSRLSYRERDEKNPKVASWGAYSRFLLSDGHTVYVNLRTMEASVSKEVDKFAQAKVEKRLAKQKRIADRKAAKEAKTAARLSKEAEEDGAFGHDGQTPEPKAKALKEKKPKAVKAPKIDAKMPAYDPGAEVLGEMAGATTASKKHNARKSKIPVVKFDKTLPTLG